MSTNTILCQLTFESANPIPFFFQDIPTVMIGQEPVEVDADTAARIFEQFPTWIREAAPTAAAVPAVEAPTQEVNVTPAATAPETDPPAKPATGSRRAQS